MGRLLALDRGARTLLQAATGAGFGAGVLAAAQFVLLAVVVDGVFLRGQTVRAVLPLLGALTLILLLRSIALWGQEVLAQRAAGIIKRKLRRQVLDHLFHLGPAYADRQSRGELANTLVQGAEELDEYLTQFWPARILAMLLPGLILLLVLLLDPPTTLILLFAGPMLLLMLALIGGRTKAITERRFLELNWMSAFFLDILQGLTTLKVFGRSREQAHNIADISRHFGKTTMDVLTVAFQTSLVMEWAATAATAMVAVEISFRLILGDLPFARAFAVLLLTPEFFLPLRQMAMKYHIGTAGKAAADRLFALLDVPAPALGDSALADPTATPPDRVSADAPRFHKPDAQFIGPIRFENVSFTYAGASLPIPQKAARPTATAEWADGGLDGDAWADQRRPAAVTDLTMEILPDATTALVGGTGAGKSTVANLLLGFVAPDRGHIHLGEQPLATMDCAAWRSQIAWVPQRPHLFHGSISDNIRLARPTADREAVMAAARAAHAHEFILRLPQGYATPVGQNGARLSMGQRQRIAIARAFLKDAPLLVLDEFTAHLDAATEALIRLATRRLMMDRTVLLIAHRMQLVTDAQQIIVMDQGRAVEVGTHAQLLARGGLYTALFTTHAASAPRPPQPEDEAKS